MENIAFGPYIGDFKYEVFYFLPYVQWVCDVLKPSNVFIRTHFNREFLYKHITDNISYIDPFLTIDELSQKKHFNKTIFKPTFTQLENDFKKYLKNNFNGYVTHYNFDYNKFKIPCSFYQTKFTKINNINKERFSDKIIFIPDRIEKEPKIKEIYSFLKEKYSDKLLVIGDKKTYLHEENFLLNKEIYSKIVYEEMINIISSCSCVICPASYWTGISNLQNKNVFSWGNLIARYKQNEIYNFNNNGKYLPNLDTSIIKIELQNFLEKNND